MGIGGIIILFLQQATHLVDQIRGFSGDCTLFPRRTHSYHVNPRQRGSGLWSESAGGFSRNEKISGNFGV